MDLFTIVDYCNEMPVVSVSPIIAPTVGGYITAALG